MTYYLFLGFIGVNLQNKGVRVDKTKDSTFDCYKIGIQRQRNQVMNLDCPSNQKVSITFRISIAKLMIFRAKMIFRKQGRKIY